MKRLSAALMITVCAATGVLPAGAITVDELGTGSAETVIINASGIGTLPVDAGILKLDVGGMQVDGFCIDPFHFSSGSMSGYSLVGLTSAPKGNLMSADTALHVQRLWGSYYSPGMSASDAAGLQIAIWELTGGSGFNLISANDFGAAALLAAVDSPSYNGPVADLLALTGPGQDYAVEAASVRALTVANLQSTWLLLIPTMVLLVIATRKTPRLALIQP